MGDLKDYGIDLGTLERMYEEWRGGVSKSELERRYLDKPESHGKVFSSLVRRHLGIETEKRSPLSKENASLKRILRSHGIDSRRAEEPTPLRRSRARDVAQFYAYVDLPPNEVRRRLERILDDVVEPIRQTRGSEIEITIEVRATLARPVDAELRRQVVGSVFDMGFAAWEFEE